jgi:hypothetical protein
VIYVWAEDGGLRTISISVKVGDYIIQIGFSHTFNCDSKISKQLLVLAGSGSMGHLYSLVHPPCTWS